MASSTETGLSNNVGNFEQLISYCTGYGTAYNPSKAALKTTALTTLLTAAKSAMTAVNNTEPAYNNAVAARTAVFTPLAKLVTRITNAAAATDITPDSLDSIKTIARKLQGRRATAKTTVDQPQSDTPTTEGQPQEDKTISASHMGYDQRLNNFEALIQQLTSLPLYIPNEADLKVAALTTQLNDLKAKNTAVITTTTPLSNARINRDKVFYQSTVGLVDVAADVKQYVKSLFGATSPQYKQVSKLKFYKRKTV